VGARTLYLLPGGEWHFCRGDHPRTEITRLRSDTGFRPEYDVEPSVRDDIDWLRRHAR
jgi:nucleoside-diphosphate-sugar epimerase